MGCVTLKLGQHNLEKRNKANQYSSQCHPAKVMEALNMLASYQANMVSVPRGACLAFVTSMLETPRFSPLSKKKSL